MLQELGHPQPPAEFILDNSTTDNFIKNKITQKRSKSWDMQHYWLRDQTIQKKSILNFSLRNIRRNYVTDLST